MGNGKDLEIHGGGGGKLEIHGGGGGWIMGNGKDLEIHGGGGGRVIQSKGESRIGNNNVGADNRQHTDESIVALPADELIKKTGGFAGHFLALSDAADLSVAADHGVWRWWSVGDVEPPSVLAVGGDDDEVHKVIVGSFVPQATCDLYDSSSHSKDNPFVFDLYYHSHIEYRWGGEGLRKTLVKWASSVIDKKAENKKEHFVTKDEVSTNYCYAFNIQKHGL
nr:probable sucrose-phosphate synthase 1 [Tanacetum cinerariifolium]